VIEASRTSWHEQRAADSATAGDWFAVEFHRRWLTRLRPASGLARYQHGETLARLGRHDEAKQEFVAALGLKTSLPPLIAVDCHAMLGQWKEALELFSAQATPQATNPQTWPRYTELALVSGGQAGYRSACEKMAQQFGAMKSSVAANSTAWACVLGPDALPDMTPAVGLARLAVKFVPTDPGIRNTLVLCCTGPGSTTRR
jgi:hypothetical protein